MDRLDELFGENMVYEQQDPEVQEEDEWASLDDPGVQAEPLEELHTFEEDRPEESLKEEDLYLLTADDRLRELGMEPCAARWVSMNVEERRQIYRKLVDLRDQSQEFYHLTVDAAFLLNSKLVFRKCHERCREHHTKDAVQTAFSDFWSYARMHWKEYDPEKSLFTSYLNLAYHKVASTASIDMFKISDSKHYAMRKIARAEAQIMQETGTNRVDDVVLRIKTGVTSKMIKQYREYRQVMSPAELNTNLKITESFSSGKRHLKSPESVVLEDELTQKLTNRIYVLLRKKTERRIALLGLGLTDAGQMAPTQMAIMYHWKKQDTISSWLRIRNILQNDPEVCEMFDFETNNRRKTLKGVQIERLDEIEQINGLEEETEIVGETDLPQTEESESDEKNEIIINANAVSSAELDEIPADIPSVDLGENALPEGENVRKKKDGRKKELMHVQQEKDKEFDLTETKKHFSEEVSAYEVMEMETEEENEALERRMASILKLYEAAEELNIVSDMYFVSYRDTQENVIKQMKENGQKRERISRKLPLLRRILEDLDELEGLEA